MAKTGLKRPRSKARSRKRRRAKLNENAVIRKVVRKRVTARQRRKRVPEWSRISAEQKRLLRELSDRQVSRDLVKKHGRRLGKIPARKSQLIQLPEAIRIRDLIRPELLLCRVICPWRRLRVRKNQADWTVDEWERFISAVNALMTSGIQVPTYQDFVDIHVQAMTTSTGLSWGAHGNTNFLPWHRDYLFSIESRLRLFNPLVTLPYWDWSVNRNVPARLRDPDDVALWGITRNTSITGLPTPTNVNNTLAQTTWGTFRAALESIHNTVHVRVGGDMMTAGSPRDPVFWMHHAFVDKIWADWQKVRTGSAARPANTTETLQPAPLITRTVSQTLSTVGMGYVYV
jgi:tyrosinase